MKDRLEFTPIPPLYCSFVIVDLIGVEVGFAVDNTEPMHVKLPVAWVRDWCNADEPMVRFRVTPTSTFDVVNGKVCTESLLVLQVWASSNVMN